MVFSSAPRRISLLLTVVFASDTNRSQSKSHAAHQSSHSSDAGSQRVLPAMRCVSPGPRQQTFSRMRYNFTECSDLCDETDWCNVIEMHCGTGCILHSGCSAIGLSACEGYVTTARNRNYSLDKAVSNSVRGPIFPWIAFFFSQMMFAGVTCAIADHVWKQNAGDSNSDGKSEPLQPSVKEASISQDLFNGVDVGEYHGGISEVGPRTRLAGVIAIFTAFFLVLSSTFVPFPDDGHPRGLCSLVGVGHQPLVGFEIIKHWEENPYDPHILIEAAGSVHKGVRFMHEACWKILNTDLATESTGPGCMAWCDKNIGHTPRPLCALLPIYGTIYQTCIKAESWYFYDRLFRFVPFVCTSFRSWLVAMIFGSLSFAVGWWNASDNVTKDTRPPSKDCCEEDGPFTRPTPLYFFKHAPNDYDAARRSLLTSLLTGVPEFILDINGFMVFISHGQVFHAATFFVAMIAPNSRDPLQAKAVELYLTSYRRGFRLRGVYIVEMRNGAVEGVLTLMVALHALVRQSFYEVATWSMYFSIGLTAISSVCVSLPQSAVARDLLNSDLDFNDYYACEKIKQKFGTRRLLPGIDTLALGIAVARSFGSYNILAMLYIIGLILGILLWALYEIFIKKRLPHIAKVLRFLLAFTFWPVAVTRLWGKSEVYLQMKDGISTLSDTVLYGCASLDPAMFYAHRISTLVVYWFLTTKTHPGFLSEVFDKAIKSCAERSFLELTGFRHLISAVLLSVGWLAIVAESVLYIKHRNDFKAMHKALKAHELLPAYLAADQADEEGQHTFSKAEPGTPMDYECQD